MSIDRAKHFADQAAISLQSGQAGLGLELAEQALQLQPHMGDALNLRGVALSMSGQPRPAEEAWLEAAETMPGSGKPFYNLAVHYYGLGKKQEALDWAARALVREPNHAQAFALQSMILEQASHLRPNLDLPFEYTGQSPVKGTPVSNQTSWGLAGWTLSALSLMTVLETLRETVGTNDSISSFTAIAFLGSYFGGLAFLAADANRSSRSFAWAAVYGFVGCFGGWLVIPAYLVAGLKRSANGARRKDEIRK